MLADIVRKIVPMRPRQEVATWLAYTVARSRWLTVAFYYVLYGFVLEEGIRLLPNGNYAVAFQGTEMIMPRDGIFAFIEIFREGVYERSLNLREGDIVIDVGAHVGIFTIKAAQAVGDKGLVVAVEPAPGNLALLQHNIKAYNLHNVKIVRKAAYDRAAKVRLFLSHSGACHSFHYRHRNYIEVEADTLDNIASELALDHVDFVKIDAEGAEPEILRGSERICSFPGVKLSIASYHDLPNGQPELPGIVSYLESGGFQTRVYKKQYVYAAKVHGF